MIGAMCLFSLGMGGMGENAVVNVPRTEKNFAAKLIDQSDVSVDLERFSLDGQTFLTGKFGKSEISIDFDKISTVDFYLQQGNVKARVHLKSGQLVEIILEKTKPCYGVAPFANVRIQVQDIKQINLRAMEPHTG